MIQYSNTNINNDLTRIGWKDAIKKEKPTGDNSNRLISNISVNKKESFDDQNKTINSLNEQILDLKRKMTFVTEKDKEIQQLKDKNKELKNENAILDQQIKDNNLKLNDNNELNDEIKELQKENSLLRRELHQLKNKKEEIDVEETIDFDVEVKVVEKVKVDINKLKQLIHSKLKNKQDKKVNELLNKHNITNNKEVDKDIISSLIKSLI